MECLERQQTQLELDTLWGHEASVLFKMLKCNDYTVQMTSCYTNERGVRKWDKKVRRDVI